MRKDDKSERFNQQLEKLTKLLQQQSQFHNKYILNIIEKVPTQVSSSSSETCENIHFTNVNTEPCVNRNRRDNKERSLQCDFDSIALTPNFYDSEQSHIKRRVEATAPITRLYSQLEIDKQTTTKSIKIMPCQFEQFIQSEQNAEIEWKEQEADEEDDKPTVIMAFQRKNRHCTLVNKNHQDINSYQNSAAATQNIQISFDKEALEKEITYAEAISKTHPMRQKLANKDNFKMSLDIKMSKDKYSSVNMKTCTHTKKPSESHVKNVDCFHNVNQKGIKERERGRPQTSGKLGNFQNMSKKNSYNPSCILGNYSNNNEAVVSSNDNTRHNINLHKIHKNKQERIQQDSLKNRKATTRKTKTKRGQPEPKIKCALKQEQKKFNERAKQGIKSFVGADKSRALQKRLSNDELGNFNQGNSCKPTRKNLIKTDGSFKKLNKVNYSKIQQNLKNQEHLKVQKTIVLNKFSKEQAKRHTVNQNFNKQSLDKKNSIIIENTSIPLQKQFYTFNNVIHLNKRNGLSEAAQQIKNAEKIIEKLNFEKNVPVMEKMLEENNIFKIYNMMANKYNEASKKINKKYLKTLQIQFKCGSEESYFKLKAVQAILIFFCQFFKPNSKSSMGIIAKYKSVKSNCKYFIKNSNIVQQEIISSNQKNERKTSILQMTELIKQNMAQNSNMDSIIMNCLLSCELTHVIQSLPSFLYDSNVLCDERIQELFRQSESIHEQIDNQRKIELFMIKKSQIFVFFHELVEFVKFLCQFNLVERVQRHNIRVNRIDCLMIGYYSSRSRRQQHQNKQRKINRIANGKSRNKCQNRKGCSSERKITQEIDTDRQRIILEGKIKNSYNNSSQKNINSQHEKQGNKKKEDIEYKRNSKQLQKCNQNRMSVCNKLSESRQKNNQVSNGKQ